MVVMIVGDQHSIDVREILQCDGRWMHSLRSPDEWDRRHHIRKNWVRHEPHTFDLHQHTGMTKPNCLEPLGRSGFQGTRGELDDRNFELWLSDLPLAVESVGRKE